MATIIERIVEDVEFGEGPHWDIQTQSLYFVDYLTKSINRYEPATKSHFKARLDDYSSFIIPVEGQHNKFVVSGGKNIAIVTWDGIKENIEEIKTLVKVDNFDNKNKLNDGKCDVLGRLWTANRRVLFSFTKNQIEGMPDGMTIDDDDNLWIAVFRGSKIIKISTNVPQTILDTINLPAKQVTSAAWGGKGLDELYVTTGILDDTSLKPPVNGSLYKITALKARGLPMYNFRL